MTKSFAPLHSGNIITQDVLEHIISGFSDLSLPKAEWTHAAHLITGLYLVRTYGLAKSETIMPNMIRTYNEAKGDVNSDTDGYHHTLTIFYLRVLAKYNTTHSDMSMPDLWMPEMCMNLLAAPQGQHDYPLKHYTKATLFSRSARKDWVEPDLKSI